MNSQNSTRQFDEPFLIRRSNARFAAGKSTSTAQMRSSFLLALISGFFFLIFLGAGTSAFIFGWPDSNVRTTGQIITFLMVLAGMFFVTAYFSRQVMRARQLSKSGRLLPGVVTDFSINDADLRTITVRYELSPSPNFTIEGTVEDELEPSSYHRTGIRKGQAVIVQYFNDQQHGLL